MSDPCKIDLRSLRQVLAIIDRGSFARAAEALGITQPALSRSVVALERSLGVRLFDRGRFGTVPTSFGRLLVERGRTLLADADAIEREVRLLEGADVGALAVGTATYPAEISVGEAAARLIARRPGLRLRVVVADWPELIRRVLAEELDLAICDYEAAEGDERLSIEALPTHEGFLYCRTGHPLEHVAPLDAATMRQYPLAMNSLPPRVAPLAGSTPYAASAGTPAIHVDTVDLVRKIVLGSDALGLAAWCQIAADVQAGRVALLNVPRPWVSSRYGFIRRARRTASPSASRFMEIVREVEEELSQTRPEGPEAAPGREAGPSPPEAFRSAHDGLREARGGCSRVPASFDGKRGSSRHPCFLGSSLSRRRPPRGPAPHCSAQASAGRSQP